MENFVTLAKFFTYKRLLTMDYLDFGSRFRKDYAWLNEMLMVWGRKLLTSGALCVAISRKAPRIMEWCVEHLMQEGVEAKSIVTEIALPFVDFDEEKKVLVVDEAIYHGTTFEKVLQMVMALQGHEEQVLGMPFVVTDEALESDAIVKSLFDRVLVLTQDDTNFLIDAIISKFNELGKPYDIEYPLFYINIDERLSSSVIDDQLCKCFKDFEDEFYMTSSYQLETHKSFHHFTLLTDFVYEQLDGCFKPDFSKIRFFYKTGRLCVASMSPFVINEEDISFDSPLFQEDLLEAWHFVYKNILNDADDENVNYQREKSLVVLANYLLSFEHFLKLKSLLIKYIGFVFGESLNWHLSLFDLQLLVGYKLASELKGMLEKILENPADRLELYNFTPLSCHVLDCFIPKQYEQQYRLQVSLDNMLAEKNVTNMMSNQFSNMHWLVELKSRDMARGKYGRLRFGESLHSMVVEFKKMVASKYNVSQEVHKGLDFRIDQGSVVPNYIRQKTTFDTYWQRLFRCGENEDLLKDRYFRVFVNLVSEYANLCGGRELMDVELSLLVALLVNTEGIVENQVGGINRYFAAPTISVFEKKGWSYRININENESYDIIDRANKFGLIDHNNDLFYTLVYSDYTEALKGNLGVADSDELFLKQIAGFVHNYNNDVELLLSTDIKELSNYVSFDEKSFCLAFQDWLTKVSRMINEDDLTSIESLEKEWVNFYVNLPDPMWQKDFTDIEFCKINNWISKKIKRIQECHIVVNLIYRLHGAFYVLNLYLKYARGVISDNYDDFMLHDFKNYISETAPDDELMDRLQTLCDKNENKKSSILSIKQIANAILDRLYK